MLRKLVPTVVMFTAILAFGCSDDSGGDPGDGGGNPDGNGFDGGPDGSGGDGGEDASIPTDDAGNPIIVDGGSVMCRSGICQCSDGIDNDMDGLIDEKDPECTGGADDREDSFATGIPGDNMDPKQDCFFDGNSGAGNDKCDNNCFVPDPPSSCSQDDIDFCKQYCGARTPPSCDCFGCCAVEDPSAPTGIRFIHLGSGPDCSLDNLAACDSCEQTTCGDPTDCGECELCLGKTLEDLRMEGCFDDDAGMPEVCPFGRTPCNTSADCGAASYCSGGCCAPLG